MMVIGVLLVRLLMLEQMSQGNGSWSSTVVREEELIDTGGNDCDWDIS